SIPKPLVGAATTYFVGNTLLIAAAIALSTQQSIVRVWNENFLWSAPSYFVGAGAAAIAASVIDQGGYWWASLVAAPLYLTYRTYKVYMGRIQDQQRHVAQVSDLHLATIEALALAIDAKDQTAESHIRRAHPVGRRLFRRADVGASVSQGDEPGRRRRAAQAGKRQSAGSARRPDLHRDVLDACRRSGGEPGAGAQADARADAVADGGAG